MSRDKQPNTLDFSSASPRLVEEDLVGTASVGLVGSNLVVGKEDSLVVAGSLAVVGSPAHSCESDVSRRDQGLVEAVQRIDVLKESQSRWTVNDSVSVALDHGLVCTCSCRTASEFEPVRSHQIEFMNEGSRTED
jgi:hypothetical protein